MLIVNHITLQPYDVDMYVMSTTTKQEDKEANKLFRKESKKIGIDVFGDDDDGRDYISAFCNGCKKKRITTCIYIHNKKIDVSSLDHELIHALNFINEHYAISTKYGEDESVACFFEYMKKEFLKLLKISGIKVTPNRIVTSMSQKQTKTQETSIC